MRGTWLLFVIAMLVTPSIALAQTTEPVGTVSTGDDEVSRAYNNPDVYFDAMSGMFVFGTVYGDETAASRSLDTTAAIFAASLRSGLSSEEMGSDDYELGELEEIESEPIGDESRASRLPFELFGSFDGEYGIVIVRQGAWVQVLVGFGVGEVDVVPELAAIATAIEPRWPSDEPIAVREDGLRTGGIWNMTPMPEDLPDGFVIDEEFEEGPATTVDTIVPAGTPVPDTAEAPPVAEEEAPSSERELPLIPVEATDETDPTAAPAPTGTPGRLEPITAPIEPTPPTASPTPETEPTVADAAELVATPVMHERLARPLDVSFEIIIAEGNYAQNDDGSCSGSGLIDTLVADGELALREDNGDALATTTIEGVGLLAYDTVLEQDVCYMTARFTDVPGRSDYILVAGESVIGRFGYEELATGEPVLVVVGAE